jgi:hypothetical protein
LGLIKKEFWHADGLQGALLVLFPVLSMANCLCTSRRVYKPVSYLTASDPNQLVQSASLNVLVRHAMSNSDALSLSRSYLRSTETTRTRQAK